MSEAAQHLASALLSAPSPPPSAAELTARRVFDHPSSRANDSPAPRPAGAVSAAPLPSADERAALVAKLAAQSDGLPLGPEIGVAIERALLELGHGDDEAKEAVSDWLGTFAAHGIASSDAADLVGIAARVMRDGQPDEATEAQWVGGINESLVSTFGSQGAADEAADVARAYVQRDPALVQFLDETRLGNHPRVIASLTRAAMNARRAGKF